ncbi:hypothetical protein OV207_28125 [Corallococcus sp. BB11-1]|nr:hypothetical protein [Corallococcus sp. BB11-1]MCY1035346.1 hypothetical protein [Corallococcus sp. BB11-1]
MTPASTTITGADGGGFPWGPGGRETGGFVCAAPRSKAMPQ